MINEKQFKNELQLIIQNAIREDVGDGDHSSLACIPSSATGKANFWSRKMALLLAWLSPK